MKLYAHSKPGAGEDDWQPLFEHLKNVSVSARIFAESFNAGDWGAVEGLWHDYGKASVEYQARLRGSVRRVDHSTAGAQLADLELKSTGRLIAACIAGHHSGLMDGISEDHSCLLRRLQKEDIPPLIVESHALPKLVDLPRRLPFKLDRKRKAFQISFFIRMLFSCLVDADFLDTERFLDPQKAAWRGNFPVLTELEHRFEKRMRDKLVGAEPTEINHYRREILETCLARAEDPPGLFSLTVPTGGGKTLSSLAFALRHALRYGLKRIIYVIPFTSIIEQNAEVFREFLQEDAVLEHHSALDTTRFDRGGSEQNENLRPFELATENWDAPLVITTGVQFFESFFACRTSRCRKLHNIAQSVVILDEAQMIPTFFLLPILESIRELAQNYGTTVVLCTATQPALSHREDFPKGLEGVREIIANPRELYEVFRRVTVESAGELSMDQLADHLSEHEQALCVVNTRREARGLFERLRGMEGVCHLSALMCPKHRSEKLTMIRERLRNGQPCRLVSTRLIEAGVDIDFPIVFRALGGIDSIAQAAGRCNREGKLPYPGRVIVYMPEEGLPPGNFRPPAESASEIMRKYPDVLSLDAVEDYFRLLYWRSEKRLDSKGILEDLNGSLDQLLFPFRSIAERFRLIPDEGESVFIPWDEKARESIKKLCYVDFPGSLLRQCQRYAVQIPWRMVHELETVGAVDRIRGIYPVLNDYGFEHFYREEIGLIWEGNIKLDPESLCI